MIAITKQRHARDGDDARVRAVLEPDQLVEARRRPYERRELSAGALTVMWGLRVYAILMVMVVAYSVARAIAG